MAKFFVGRENEQLLLNEYLNSDQSEFVVVYGRRRVGKTFLIQHVIGDDYAFYAAGMHDVPMRIQVAGFVENIKKKGGKVNAAKNWFEAFGALEQYLEGMPEGRKVIFIDEMPWMDTSRSNFISALEHFWNAWASWRNDIKLIVCGSATSWIINNLIKSRGGLHNRVTHKIALRPFTLRECQQFFTAMGFRYSFKQIAECYMVMGGVPFYMSKMDKGESLAQNVDRLFFADNAELRDEFQSLYGSLYRNATNHIKVVTALASKGMGMTRKELLSKTRIANNGKFSTILEELECCGFIRSYDSFVVERGKAQRRVKGVRRRSEVLYQLVDMFTLFYFQILSRPEGRDANYWTNNQNSHVYSVWSGLSFERLCFNHVEQIKRSLGISGVVSNVFSWFGKGEHGKVQVDMLIDRADKTINLCEMKFYGRQYAMTAKDEDVINQKVSSFIEATGTDKSVVVTMITVKGIAHNEYSGCVQKELTLEQLFC